MLTALSIRDVVLVDVLDLEVESGLTVLTGETGAGKSILLDGLGLALGERADAAMVREGAAQASATATFQLSTGHPALALAADNDILLDHPGELVLRRTLKADGGSRAHVNDVPVSATLLRQFGQLLVEIHGQHDERGLLNPRGHMALLDAFAGNGALMAEASAAHAAWKQAAAATAEAAGLPPAKCEVYKINLGGGFGRRIGRRRIGRGGGRIGHRDLGDGRERAVGGHFHGIGARLGRGIIGAAAVLVGLVVWITPSTRLEPH
jgi:hypothetical protein